MIFVFDLDDTICETDKFSEKFIKKFIKQHKLPYKQICKVARFAEMKFDWSEIDAINWYKTYGDEMFLHFKVKNNSVKIINKLYNLGHTIIISTARNTDWHSEPEKYTKQWLKKVGLKYHKIYIGRQDKEEICKLENADFFIDDDFKLVTKVQSYFNTINKGKTFLSVTKYNKTLNISKNINKIKNLKKLLKEAKKKTL